MNKKILMSAIISLVLISALAVYSFSSTGLFSKAFTKTVYPNQMIEENITIRKFYNLTIRFRTSPDGSDLSFTDSNTLVILKDANKNETNKSIGITNGKVYLFMDKLQIDSIKFVDAFNVGKYANVTDQEASITFIGTKAYFTIIVSKLEGNATLTGYIFDKLTSQPLSGITILAFSKGLDPNTTQSITQNLSLGDGKYFLILPTDSDGRPYDIYIQDYAID